MASLNQRDGRWAVQIVTPAGRKTLSLGKLTKPAARRVHQRIQELEDAARVSEPPNAEALAWTHKIDDDLHARLSTCGLCPPRQATTLGKALDAWFERVSSEVKPATMTARKQANRFMLTYFDAKRPLSSITQIEAEDFAHWLRRSPVKLTRTKETGQGLSEATARKHCQTAKRFFEHCRRRGLVSANPFDSEAIKTGAVGNDTRRQYIPAQDVIKVLEHLPSDEWRLLVVCARWLGLRTPSEPKRLTWADIDWAGGAIRVRSPKTEHHEGKAERIVPMLPEVEPFLQQVFEQAPEGSMLVFPMLNEGKTAQALRNPLKNSIRLAGLTEWPRLWQNLRASAETDLAAKYPLASVCKWIGNSPAIASKHYLSARDADFEAARVGGVTGTLSNKSQRNTAPALHERCISQQDTVGLSGINPPDEIAKGIEGDAKRLKEYPIAPAGFEPATERL